MPIHKKKRAYEKARQPSMTKLGSKRIHLVRCRGGNMKFRALRIETGNFNWASQSVTKKTRVTWVVYNATNNELVRTNTLTKNTIVEIDPTPFRKWFYRQYGVELSKKKLEEPERSEKAQEKWETLMTSWEENNANLVMDETLKHEFRTGKLLACISSRPGQSGRVDGYILEGPELDFYKKKLEKKKGKAK